MEAKRLSQDEMIALARERGIDLTDEQIEGIAGGGPGEWMSQYEADCTHCGKTMYFDNEPKFCPNCGAELEW